MPLTLHPIGNADTDRYSLSEILNALKSEIFFPAPRRAESKALRTLLDNAQVPLRSRRIHSRPYLPWFGAKHSFFPLRRCALSHAFTFFAPDVVFNLIFTSNAMVSVTRPAVK
jgi:hypothetical protein